MGAGICRWSFRCVLRADPDEEEPARTFVTVLCPTRKAEELAALLFRETGTFGIRIREQKRLTLTRSWRTVSTPYGDIRLKAGAWQGEEVSASPEYDDCKQAAVRHGVPLRWVYDAGAALGCSCLLGVTANFQHPHSACRRLAKSSRLPSRPMPLPLTPAASSAAAPPVLSAANGASVYPSPVRSGPIAALIGAGLIPDPACSPLA